MDRPSDNSRECYKSMHYDERGEETIISREAIEAGMLDHFKLVDLYDCEITSELMDIIYCDFDYREDEDDTDDSDEDTEDD